MGLWAGALAVPLGLVLAAVLVFVVNVRSFGWTLAFDVSPAVLWQAIVLSLVAALLAGAYPAWQMGRADAAGAGDARGVGPSRASSNLTSPDPMTVSLLGLGAMGVRMAGHLLDAGHTLTVWNRSAGPADALRQRGAAVAATPAEAAAVSEVVLSMVTDDDASRAVWTGPDGALAGLAEGAVAVESSTPTPGWVRELGGVGRRVRRGVPGRAGLGLAAPGRGRHPDLPGGRRRGGRRARPAAVGGDGRGRPPRRADGRGRP